MTTDPIQAAPAPAAAAPTRLGSALVRMCTNAFILPTTALVLAVVLGGLVITNHRHAAKDDARTDATAVVSKHVAALLTYTPATVTSDLSRKEKWLTGDFRDDYQVLITKTVGPAATKGQVTAEATVVARGVQSASADRVELLMFVNVATTRADSKTPQSQGSRVRVVAEKIHGSWLISDLSPV